jgi:predicted ATPase
LAALSWTGGNPFMLAEMIDFLRAGGGLVEREGLWGLTKDRRADAEMTPTNIRMALEARIASLSSGERAALEVAALDGSVFQADIVAEVAGREPGGLDVEALEAFCQRLVDARGLLAKQTPAPEERAGEGVLFEFKHALYAQALRLGVTDTRARRIHGELGVLHERRGDAPPHVLAHHFERAGRPAGANPARPGVSPPGPVVSLATAPVTGSAKRRYASVWAVGMWPRKL